MEVETCCDGGDEEEDEVRWAMVNKEMICILKL